MIGADKPKTPAEKWAASCVAAREALEKRDHDHRDAIRSQVAYEDAVAAERVAWGELEASRLEAVKLIGGDT